MTKKQSRVNFNKKTSAFSLIEVLIAMSILTLIIGGITLFSVRTIQSHSRSQAMQNALDNARFAIESINKMARTSKLDSTTANDNNASSVRFKNNSDGKTYEYSFDGANKKLTLEIDGGGKVPLVGDGGNITITGHFETRKEDTAQRGFVATEIVITYNVAGSPSEKDSVTIRSGVSTRY